MEEVTTSKLAGDIHAEEPLSAQEAMALPPAWYIVILNKSGQPQNYAVYAEIPKVSSTMKPPRIYNNVIAVADNVQPGQGTATFTFKMQLQALCGRAELDDPDSLASNHEANSPARSATSIVEVMDRRLVQLGAKNANGSTSLGTEWSIHIVNQETPAFSTQSTLGGGIGAFSIKTGSDFTNKDAKSRESIPIGLHTVLTRHVVHYFLGFASDMTATIGPFALFVPSPNQLYEITPVNTFYVLVADLEPRSVVTDAQKSTALKINFDEYGVDSVKIVHDENGNLTPLKPNSDPA